MPRLVRLTFRGFLCFTLFLDFVRLGLGHRPSSCFDGLVLDRWIEKGRERVCAYLDRLIDRLHVVKSLAFLSVYSLLPLSIVLQEEREKGL